MLVFNYINFVDLFSETFIVTYGKYNLDSKNEAKKNEKRNG